MIRLDDLGDGVKAIVATDEFFKALAFRAELRALARREGFAEVRAQGLTGKAASAEMDRISQQVLRNPPQDIVNMSRSPSESASTASAKYANDTPVPISNDVQTEPSPDTFSNPTKEPSR